MLNSPFFIIGIIVLIILIIIGIIIMIKVNSKPVPLSDFKLPFEIDILVNALGKIENINNVSAKLSKLNVEVKDTSLVEIDSIKKLGASGVIEKSNGYTFIFGMASEKISEELNKLL